MPSQKLRWAEPIRALAGPALLVTLLIAGCAPPQVSAPSPDRNPLPSLIAAAGFSEISARPERYHLQVLWTQIDRSADGRPQFREYRYRVGAEYFYPASTVKLPVAVLALERVNALAGAGVSAESWMVTHPLLDGDRLVEADSTTASGRPSVAHYIKRILLVSDNESFNRLYEFVGRDSINQRLQALGFARTEILHRLERPLPPAENARTNAVEFRDASGRVLALQPADTAPPHLPTRRDLLGRGYLRGDSLIHEPFDFSFRNQWTLESAHRLTQWLMFPETQPAERRLRLTADDYAFLRRYMGMWPAESEDPVVVPAAWPAYVKFLRYGSRPDAELEPGLRIYNKVGNAYGFLTDAAYVVDSISGAEFLLSATIYVNADGILNDGRYEYDALGLPFLEALGREVLAYERRRRAGR